MSPHPKPTVAEQQQAAAVNIAEQHRQAAVARAAQAAKPRHSRTVAAVVGLAVVVAGVWAWAAGHLDEPIAQARAAIGVPAAEIAEVARVGQATTVADRQAAVVDDLTASLGDGPAQAVAPTGRAGAPQPRPAAIGPPPAEITTAPDEAASAPGSGSAAAAPAAPKAPAKVPSSIGLLSDRVVDLRRERAAHLRWLDACRKQRLVENARRALELASEDASRRAAHIACTNLAANIQTHEREAVRLAPLIQANEERLAEACRKAGIPVPELEDPPTTVSGAAARARPAPEARRQQAAAAPARGGASQIPTDPFASP